MLDLYILKCLRKEENMEYHKPVLFDEVIDNIITKKDAVYVDCTLGGGGHTEGILQNSSENSKVVIRIRKLLSLQKKDLKNMDTNCRYFRTILEILIQLFILQALKKWIEYLWT